VLRATHAEQSEDLGHCPHVFVKIAVVSGIHLGHVSPGQEFG
jgi:hypothetical protein